MTNHSFVVMAYKNSPFLDSCLESLFLQKRKSHVIIATSTPSDYINNVAGNYGVEVFVNTQGKGIADDWNFGLEQVKTKYVTLAHQDDIYLPEYTLNCLSAAEKFSDTLICFTNYRELDLNQEAKKNMMMNIKESILFFFMPFKKNMRRNFWKKLLLTFGNPIACPSVMYNIEQLRGFRFSKEYSISLDWEAWYRMSGIPGRFVYVPHTLMKHRIHLQSETTAGLEANIRQAEDLRMFKKLWPVALAKFLVMLYSGSYKLNQKKVRSQTNFKS
jgi:glycosyltransferase involved in cell wall biosynthesis